MPDEVTSSAYLLPTVTDTIGVTGLENTPVLPQVPGGAPVVDYHMAVWNTTNGNWVRWISPNAPDPTGTLYPGPGTFGVDTQATAVVEFIL